MVNKKAAGYFMQSVGLILLALCIVAAILAAGNVKSPLKAEFTVMFAGTLFAVVLAGFKLISLAVILGIIEELGYVVYKLVQLFVCLKEFDTICYVWFMLPMFSVGAMLACIYGSKQVKICSLHLSESRIK